MPTVLLDAYAQQYRPLAAEEALRLAEIGQVGSGAFKKGSMDRIVRGWQRDTQPLKPIRARTREQYLADMRRVGLGVR